MNLLSLIFLTTHKNSIIIQTVSKKKLKFLSKNSQRFARDTLIICNVFYCIVIDVSIPSRIILNFVPNDFCLTVFNIPLYFTILYLHCVISHCTIVGPYYTSRYVTLSLIGVAL